MKKLSVLFACLFAFCLVAKADDDKAIRMDQLPARAQQFVTQYFKGSSVAVAKMEKDWFDKTYDVIFSDGNKVEFNKLGEWKEVDCKYSEVPSGIVPTAISTYVSTTYADTKIVKIDRDKKDYEINLSNGTELKFDLKFNLIDLDRR